MDTHTLAVAYIEPLEARDRDGVGARLVDDVVYEMPQTRERITGREKFMRFNVEYPSNWHLAIRRVVAKGPHAAIWLDVRDDRRHDGRGLRNAPLGRRRTNRTCNGSDSS
jgi:hypothetical protein